MKNRLIHVVFFGLLLVSLLAGCAAPAAAAISIEGAWGRPSPSIAGAGAMYLVVKNTGGAPDKLLSAKSGACGMAEIHETVKKADGTMGMNMVTDPIVVPAGGQVELKSGGLHVMCMMKKDDQWKTGSKVDLTLVFEKSGEKQVSVEVREQ